jgi:hypothetical protein
MPIDIDRLNYEQLIDLNNRVVARLKFLEQMQAHSAMLEFRVGERVAFQPPGQGELQGVLVKYNQKTVTVLTDAGQSWKVAPGFLRKAPSKPAVQPATAQPDKPTSGKVVNWPKG